MKKQTSWAREDWLINYPDGIIKYNDMFRHTLLGYDEVVDILYEELEKHNVKSLLDLGCGTGTFLEKLCERKEYECVGIDISSETIDFAREKVKNRNLPIKFELGDALDYDLNQKFDAVIEMFVPFSKKSQMKMIKNAHKYIKEDGIFLFMVCEAIEGTPPIDQKIIMTFSENETTRCARIEPWEKENNFLQWNPLLLIEEEGKFKYYNDHDEIQLYDKDELAEYLKEIEEVGYKIINKYALPVRDSSPPWSTETIFVARKTNE